MTPVSARVSVVVPIYNVAPYLETCLESLAQQTLADLEIVIVDDGSTDESAVIAERFAARDQRFRLVRQANAGLGAARNTGSDHARGEFLAFVDSDDLLPRRAYEALVGALDRTGSDFASGNAQRLTSLGTTQARFLAAISRRTRLRTHVTRFPPLLADRTAWNKLFRRSFWDRHGFRFPEGVLYEDIPVTIPAHYLARSVDVLDQTVYLWRLREGGDLSITQRRTETKALRDRVAAVDYVSRFLAEQGFAASKWRYDRSVLAQDLRYFLNVLARADDEYRRLFLELVNDFLDRADPSALEQSLAIDRLKWQLVRRRALPELLEVLRFEDEELGDRPPVRVGRRWYGDYPRRTDGRLPIARDVYRLDEELALVARVNAVRWDGDALTIEGYAYIDMIGAPRPDSQRIEVFVRAPGRLRRPMRLRTEPQHRPDVTASAAQQLVALDWSGFVATLDGAELRRGRLREGIWSIGIVVHAGGVVRKSWYFDRAPLHPVTRAETSGSDGAHVQATLGSGGKLSVNVARQRSLVRSYFLEDGVIQVEGELGSVGSGGVTFQVVRRGSAPTLEYPIYVDRSAARPTFLARVPVADLFAELDVADGATRAEEQASGVVWELFLAGGGRVDALTLPDTVPESTWSFFGREIVVGRGRAANATLTHRSFRPVVTGAEWSSGGTLLLTGWFHAPAGEYELLLATRSRAEACRVPLQYDVDAARFTAELTPAAVASLAGSRPLGEGLWELLVRPTGSGREAAAPAVLDHELLAELPLSAGVGQKRFHFGVVGYDFPVLAVERDLDERERGGFRQHRLRTSFYRAKRGGELRDAVLYDCFGGRQYSDSPRAIHEELVRRGAPFEHLWVVRDGACEVPASAVRLRELSADYYEAFARARYIVTNDHWPRWFVRRSDQTCVQTWHGVPLKRHGHDLVDRPRALREYRRALRQRADNWQYVVSPGPFATPILERAFRVAGETIETGLPRTDLLFRDRARTADDVKRRLQLGDKRVVLYAPTYRDHLDYRAAPGGAELGDVPTYRAESASREGYRLGPLLDFAALHSALGDGHVVLFRKHPRILDALPAAAEPFVRDVSEFPDVMELVLVTDILVTDYSSLAFDFAGTGRPIVFFTPDVETYRDEVRGFSLDFEGDAPGPLLETTGDVIDALRDPDALHARYRERYERFVASYCSLADGNASARVVDRVFRW